MMEIEDPDYSINNMDMEKKIEHLQKLFCKSVFDEVESGNSVDKDDLEETIRYYADKEEYEKCIILKNALNKY